MRYLYASVLLILFTLAALGQSGYFGSPVGTGGGGTTINDQDCSPDVMQSITSGTFGCVAVPTPAPVPASTPVAGQAVTGWGSNVSSPSRSDFQAPLPTDAPTAGKAVSGWDGAAFTLIDVLTPSTGAGVGTCTAGLYVNATGAGVGPTCNQVDMTQLSGQADLTTQVKGVLPVANGGAPCTGAGCILTNAANFAGGAYTYDFSGVTWFKLPVINGTLAAVSGYLYCDGSDGYLHYSCGGSPVDTSIQSNTAGAGISITAGTVATDSTKAGFIAAGALTCGAATAGKMQIHTTPLQYCDNAATPALKYAAYGSSTGEATLVPYHKCVTYENLKDTDDAMFIDAAPAAGATITGISCHCKGTCASTLATFIMQHGAAGTAMTITGTNPTCTTQGTTPTAAAVTANNTLAAYEDFSFSVSNTPTNNGIDTYMVCVDGTSP